MSLPNSVLESRVIITALGPSIVCLGKPNPATANFNSSLLKLLSASWLAESAVREREREREREMGNGTEGSARGEETERGQGGTMHERTRGHFLATGE